MSGLIILLGSLMVFANPDVRSDTGRFEFNYYDVRGSAAGVTASGATGWGMEWLGEYRDESPLRHSVGFGRYNASDYEIMLYTLGIDYTTLIPNRPVQLAVGLEIGSAGMSPSKSTGAQKAPDKLGWGAHTEITQYFVFMNRLFHVYARPSWRYYNYPLEKSGRTYTITGPTYALTGGLGFEF